MNQYHHMTIRNTTGTTTHTSEKRKRGRLKIFLGYASGVGKTYSMIDDAHEKFRSGIDVVVGYVEPHATGETKDLLEGLPSIPMKTIKHGSQQVKEFDLDAALERKPEVLLVDELAHSNAPEMRNKKRYLDIEELLNAGIDVYTTLNIQNLESLNDVVQRITKVDVNETIPDYIFDSADTVEIIDFSPDELLKRFEEGKISRPVRSLNMIKFIFTKENLRLLREIAMRKAADRISHDNQSEKIVKDKIVSTKFLVYIDPSMSSSKSIRWAARAADAFHAPWVAVYVDNNGNDNEAEIQDNLDLAKRLGAEAVRLNGYQIAETLAEYARISGITNIVIGNIGRKSSLSKLWKTNIEEKLVTLLPNVEIHIIPELPRIRYRKQRKIKISENLIFTWADTGKTIAIMGAATLLSMGLGSLNTEDQTAIMLYILSVLIISRITDGYLYGIAASVLSVLLFNFFFTMPLYSFNVIQSGYPITFTIMFIAAFITSTLTVRIKTQIKLSAEREHRTKLLYEINKKFLVTRGLDNIVNLTNEYITKIFDRAAVFYTDDPNHTSAGYFMESMTDPYTSNLMEPEERAVAQWVYVNKKRAGAGTDTLKNAMAFYYPILSQGNILGVIGVSCVKGKLDQDNRQFLRMLASHAAMALERQRLSDEQRRILVDSEREKVRSNLLRAISRELRCPLNGIAKASTELLEKESVMDLYTKNHMIAAMGEDAKWLTRMVENLLSITKLNEGKTTIMKSPEWAIKVLEDALNHLKRRHPERKLVLEFPEEDFIVPMDRALIEQVLINIVENAILYSMDQDQVIIRAKLGAGFAVFEVQDQGKPIASEELSHVFDGCLYQDDQSVDGPKRVGSFGLAISMSIIKAHEGILEATNLNHGGVQFTFQLPLEEKHSV